MFRKTAGELRRLLRCESGATAIEYGLIAGLIAVVLVGGLASMGTKIQTMLYDKIAAAF